MADKPLRAIKFPDLPDTYYIPDVEISPNAEQLIGDNYVEESVPYLFREAGGSAEIGNREADMLVGGTVAWNQLCNSSSVIITNGHKYYLIKGGTKSIGASTGTAITGLTSGTDIVIDLTQMFGTTIADYIYSLEQATAGAGVAWFRKLFPKDYYEYNTGELISVSGVSAHEMTGFNQWDEEWEVGGYAGSTGAAWDTNTRIRSKTTNYISVLPNTTYYANMPSGTSMYFDIMFYNAGKTFISSTDPNAGTTFTTPSDARFMRFASGAAYGTTYNHDICINFSDPIRNGEYEPYKKHSYPLDDSLTLRGIPKLDSNNQLYYDGDTYEHDGTVTRRYGIVDLGTLNWNYLNIEDHKRFVAPFSSKPASRNLICTKYQDVGYSAVFNNTVEGISIHTDGRQIAVYDTAYTDAATFKAAMSGVMLVYELATPTTETADAFTEYQSVDKYGTEEYVSTSIVPVGHVTKYYENLTQKIERLPKDFSTLIAPVEETTTATQNYSAGDYLILNNQLYKVTASITAGETITAGTNVTATTIMQEILALG